MGREIEMGVGGERGLGQNNGDGGVNEDGDECEDEVGMGIRVGTWGWEWG